MVQRNLGDASAQVNVLLMTRVIILGGEGMLGQMVLKVFSRSKEIAVKHTSRARKIGAFYFGVEEGIGRLREIVEVHGPFDYVINCIGVLSKGINEEESRTVARAILVNSLFPRELVALSEKIGARVIHISTDGVFGQNAGVCLEDRPPDPSDIYGKTKSLGEVIAPGFLNLRCSIIGPNTKKRRGLLEWFLRQPQGGEIYGYTDHIWNGVTTVQFANLCLKLVVTDSFDAVRNEGPIHHFCPNSSISKYELMVSFKNAFRPDMNVNPTISEGGPLCRILDTQYKSLKAIFRFGRPMKDAINELLAEMLQNGFLLKNSIQGDEDGKEETRNYPGNKA